MENSAPASLLANTSVIGLGTEGISAGCRFAVIGRLVRAWECGYWSEWYLKQSDGHCAWLTDAGGELAIYADRNVAALLPPPGNDLQPGDSLSIEGSRYVVVDIKRAEISRIDGRVPQPAQLGESSLCADLEGVDGRCATLEISPDGARRLYLGRFTSCDALQLSRLRMPAGWIRS